MTKPQTYSFFMLLKATRPWLDKAPPERFAYVKDIVNPILEAHPAVSMRFFDSESYSAKVSDVALWETPDLVAYQQVIRKLRDTLFWNYYFEVLDIIPAVEEGYAAYYDMAPLTARQ
ncbi:MULTISPECIES: darcynin family protein [Thiomonas]|uniref:Darcynin n=1 Tax=Thiomonas arsenitoxydans (strain DSM 22701 / CIP 110005 / 3As) TaxID=426114 RepID=A0A8I1MYK8_THIA3|nr:MULTISPECIES: darcynin family protein [Thiomonas]CQR44857.1 Darcynin homolog [Thiomonas sp. CB3]MBN8744688.1 hypothetical protein [Thiomonas arsenitoxydans]ODU91822.1 MAG: darcynin [Thiomonas sp. SCN 64-16]CDW92630.1 conserved hypothetical protein, Darcynin homolog [Thiomonas sp. CB2]VDY05666.1 Darcynin homolog [Thiomonas sp. Bio17B3]